MNAEVRSLCYLLAFLVLFLVLYIRWLLG